MPGSEESQDVGSSEESKGSLESPKQGNNKMKLKSRLSGKWETSLPVENETGSQPWEQEMGWVSGMVPLTGCTLGREQCNSGWPSVFDGSQAGLNSQSSYLSLSKEFRVLHLGR